MIQGGWTLSIVSEKNVTSQALSWTTAGLLHLTELIYSQKLEKTCN